MRFLSYSARRGGLKITPVSEVATFTDGAVLDLPGAPVVIHIPGHTPGSVAFHFASVDAVCVGDAMTTGHVLTGPSGPNRLHSLSTPNRHAPHSIGSRRYRRNGCSQGTAPPGATASTRRSVSSGRPHSLSS